MKGLLSAARQFAILEIKLVGSIFLWWFMLGNHFILLRVTVPSSVYVLSSSSDNRFLNAEHCDFLHAISKQGQINIKEVYFSFC